jgi:hypothetical protein
VSAKFGRKEVRIGTYDKENLSGGLGPVRGRVAACTPADRILLHHLHSQENLAQFNKKLTVTCASTLIAPGAKVARFSETLLLLE